MPKDITSTTTSAAPETILAEGLNTVIDNLDHWSRDQVKVHLMGLQMVLDWAPVEHVQTCSSPDPADVVKMAGDMGLGHIIRGMERFITEDPILDGLGYDTVLGWLAKNAPHYLNDLEDPIEDTIRDGFWLTHRCHERGREVIKVRSPGVMPDHLTTVNAYPVEWIETRFREKGVI